MEQICQKQTKKQTLMIYSNKNYVFIEAFKIFSKLLIVWV
jgi:hypothetical protein